MAFRGEYLTTSASGSLYLALLDFSNLCLHLAMCVYIFYFCLRLVKEMPKAVA